MALHSTAPVRVPQGLDTRLLAELQRNNLALEPPPSALLSAAQRFVALYRQAIEQLEAKVAQGEGQPPMRKAEVDLMCRCLLSCGHLDEAIACAAQFCAMLDPRAGSLSLEVQGTTATFHMDSLRHKRSSAACLVDLTGLFCYLQLFGWLIGQPLRPDQVFLAHPQREDAAPFLGLFDAPVAVGRRTYGFSFNAALLSRQVIRTPAELTLFLVDFPFRLIGAPPSAVAITQQVRGFLDAALSHEREVPALSAIAAALGTTLPTLRRRLAAEGSSYQALRRLSLCESAQRCLRDTDWTIGRIAGHLGFASEAAFRRAFLSWTGKAPSRYRAQQSGANG
ncbi:AraC family transcriptional regulator ligand-binding domain-containing protein [Pseudomonas monteilii]|nr:AraC family transcriptional regulator ligand-binding domain-containing protein [Pseudomonas monteilii]